MHRIVIKALIWKRLVRSVWKSNCLEVRCGTLKSYFQWNDHQLPHPRFDQISDPKLYGKLSLLGKLSTKLLAQTANRNAKFMHTKVDGCLLLKYGFRSNCRPSLLNQKHDVRWFLLRGFVDLLRVCSLLFVD